jgi:hypothetical protein
MYEMSLYTMLTSLGLQSVKLWTGKSVKGRCQGNFKVSFTTPDLIWTEYEEL